MGNHKIHHIPVWYTLLSAMADARRGNISQSMEYARPRTRGGARMIGAMRDLRHMYCCMYNLVCMHAAHSDTQNTPEA